MFIKDQSLAARNKRGRLALQRWQRSAVGDKQKKDDDPDQTLNSARTLLIGVNALLTWTLEHTDIVAFAIVLVFTSLIVFALSQVLWLTLNSAHHITAKIANRPQ